MIYNAFSNVYTKFKMHFYQEVFKKWGNREVSLTTVETFCMEIILALNKPTVSRFAEFTSLSSANAADKVNKLIGKGYLMKVQSEKDRRVYHLEVTQKYMDYYNISYQYMNTVMKRVEERLSPEEMQIAAKVLNIMDEELTKEVSLESTSEYETVDTEE